MRPRIVIELAIFAEYTLQVRLAPDEHMVEELASQRPDQALDMSIRLRRQNRRANHSRARAERDRVECCAELPVVVAQEEPGCPAKRGQLAQLLREPDGVGLVRGYRLQQPLLRPLRPPTAI
jgi:hypothetical protein